MQHSRQIIVATKEPAADSAIYTHHKIVFEKETKTILPEYNCNQDLFF